MIGERTGINHETKVTGKTANICNQQPAVKNNKMINSQKQSSRAQPSSLLQKKKKTQYSQRLVFFNAKTLPVVIIIKHLRCLNFKDLSKNVSSCS